MGLFDFFSGDKIIYSPSLYFLNHPFKDKYFYRTISFYYLDKYTITALDGKKARMLTFDDWPQEIFLSAIGKQTVYEFLIEMAKRYRGKVPPRLDRTVIEELEKLVDEQIINLSDVPVELDPKILNPVKV